MRWAVLAFLACICACISAEVAPENTIDRGFGKSYKWKTMPEALSEQNDKLFMVLIHRTHDVSSNKLKPYFAQSKEILALSENFNMVNLNENDDPGRWEFDGAYTPRIVFLGPTLQELYMFYNEDGNPDYKYFYQNPQHIVNTMKRVIKAYEVGSFTENAGAESDGSEDNATTMKTPTPPGSGDKAANQMAAEARKVEL